MLIPKEIFKAYDIRGIVGKSLTPEIVECLGQAIGSEAIARNQSEICIGYDGRLSGPELAAALARGIQKTGVNVVNLGMVVTPMLYFATYHLNNGCGVMVTGSHNPPEYNGLKMMLAGETLSEQSIHALKKRILANEFAHGAGSAKSYDIAPDYLAKIKSDIHLKRSIKITIDCGNGAAGAFAKDMFTAIGCEVEGLFCEVDGHFPHHHPDPSVPENLADLIQALATNQSEIGLAFDGDGDRLGVVAKNGKIIYPDRQLMLFAWSVLKYNRNGTVIYDVKSTRHLNDWITAWRGKPVMWKTGHSLMKAKIKETDAVLAGEMSGHIFFNDKNVQGEARWYGFDDGLYAGARLLEILSEFRNASTELYTLPDSVSTPELHIAMQEGEPHALIARLQKEVSFEGVERLITIDGLRVEFADGFGLMRPSNTTPTLVLRFEAENNEALERIQQAFREVLLTAIPNISLPF